MADTEPLVGASPEARDERPLSFGDHEVVRLIGRGGMGSVFEGRSRLTGAACAIKTVLLGSDSLARDRFRREGELVARCDRHPGIVKVHALGETPQGTLYMILELVRGESLDKLLDRETRVEPRRAAKMALDLARALTFVHERGIVHRDLKPGNVLLDADADGAPRLTDFGLAAARNLDRLTQTGFFVGTPYYCAPEQATGEVVGPPADVFSLGSMLFHMLTGEPPLMSPDVSSVINRLTDRSRIRDVRLLQADVPAPLAAIVARTLEKKPADRYATASELEKDLARWLENGSAPAEPPATAPPGRARPAMVALALVVVSTVFGLAQAVAALVSRHDERRHAAELARVETTAAAALLERLSRGVAPASSEGVRLVGEARERVARALERLEHARGFDLALAEEARALGRDVSIAEASELVATGRADLALETVARIASDTGPLPLPAQLVRGRALLALGRAAEARRLAATLEPDSAAALELLGDAAVASGDPRSGQACLSRALGLAPPARAHELRLKRGAAAALAGDDRTALADLAAVAPELPSSLAVINPEKRAPTAAFAPIALALYRHALEASPDVRDRELETAWQIAVPPPELARAVAKVWSKGLSHGRKLDARGLLAATQEDLDAMATHTALLYRATLTDPDVDMTEAWTEFSILRLSTEKADRSYFATLAAKLLPVWPDNPSFLYLAARARGSSPAEARIAFDLLKKAAGLVPGAKPGQPNDLPELTHTIVGHARRMIAAEFDATEDDVAPFVAAAERSGRDDCCRDAQRMLRAARQRGLVQAILPGGTLRVISRSGGTTAPDNARPRLWRKTSVLVWKDAPAQGSLVLAIPSERAGSRRLALVFDEGKEAPIVRLFLNGTPLVSELDLSAAIGLWPAEELVVEGNFVTGDNELAIEILGHDPNGSGSQLSLDWVRFPE